MKVTEIKNPEFLKDLSRRECITLAKDIRNYLINSVSKTGGHLSSNLGVVELTIALHRVFNAPEDKFIFDVGHQAYIHKMLTGRASKFDSLRQYEGLSGFQKIKESEYDCWESGHSSTSLSAAFGMAVARDLKKENYNIIPIIGDGALTGGMALEALNNIGDSKSKVVIIFNDNEMSISKNVGGLNTTFSRLRSSRPYIELKKDIKGVLRGNKPGEALLKGMRSFRNIIKKGVVKDSVFGEYGLDYLGPINGHSFAELIPALEMAKAHEGSIVIHVVTRKGMGYAPALNDLKGAWHGVGKFNVKTGEFLEQTPSNMKTWSEIASDELCKIAATNEKLCVITPAMIAGSKLEKFYTKYPDRLFDCGIAEQHAMTFSAGLAISGFIPFISIYSSFLQRCYDQIHHDVARLDLPVVIGIDRCGIVGEDGETHQGIYDISFLSPIPNIIISQPKDELELRCLLHTAIESNHPFAIRYPRGAVVCSDDKPHKIEIGTWDKLSYRKSQNVVITYGPEVDKVYAKAKDNEIDIDVVNARFIKPIDEKMLLEIAKEYKKIYVYETDCKIGGLGSLILSFYNKSGIQIPIEAFGIDDHFVQHGSIPKLRQVEGIDITSVLEYIEADTKK